MSWYPNPQELRQSVATVGGANWPGSLGVKQAGPKMDQHLERTLWLDTCRWIEASMCVGVFFVVFFGWGFWWFNFFNLFYFTMFVGHWIFGSRSCCSLYEYWKILEQHPYKHFWCDPKLLCKPSKWDLFECVLDILKVASYAGSLRVR